MLTYLNLGDTYLNQNRPREAEAQYRWIISRVPEMAEAHVRLGTLIEAEQLSAWNDADEIPVLIDPDADILSSIQFPVVVDARLTKQTPSPLPTQVPLHIGLGPGFRAGENCHAVIETRRSHTLGRVYWTGTTQPDSGEPEGDPRRVLRSLGDGILISKANIGEHVEGGQVIAVIGDQYIVTSPIAGMLRGLIHDGLQVTKGMKIGDVDARNDASACRLVSDKALANGGGVPWARSSRSIPGHRFMAAECDRMGMAAVPSLGPRFSVASDLA